MSACCFVWVENEIVVCAHVCISCRYDLMFSFAMLTSLCVDVVVMTSALVLSLLVPVVLKCQMGIW